MPRSNVWWMIITMVCGLTAWLGAYFGALLWVVFATSMICLVMALTFRERPVYPAKAGPDGELLEVIQVLESRCRQKEALVNRMMAENAELVRQNEEYEGLLRKRSNTAQARVYPVGEVMPGPIPQEMLACSEGFQEKNR